MNFIALELVSWNEEGAHLKKANFISQDLMFKDVKISYGLAADALQLVSELGFKDKKILFLSDKKIWVNCQRFFDKNFLKKIGEVLFLKNPKADEKNLKKIALRAKNCDLILGLGSGTISDLCKFTSAQTQIPYGIFASAASMNGYLSRNASITISGHKKTLPATLPIAVFCDLKILSSAPLVLTKAGIGDAMCFYSCWFDWYLSHKILGTKFSKKPFEMLREKMEFFVENFWKFSARDEDFLKILIEILLLSGQGMTLAGGSYPASQSEHLIAHAIEMKFPEIAKKSLHGQKIAITSLTSAQLQKNLLEQIEFPPLDKLRVTQSELEKFFGKKIAAECKKEFEQKILNAEDVSKINARMKKNWEKIRKELQEIHFEESRLRAIFLHFKIKISPKSLGLSNQQYQACVAYAKFIRNRFTCLDLAKQNNRYKNLLKAIKNEGGG